MGTGRNIEKFSRGGIYKPSVQAEILQNSQDVEFINYELLLFAWPPVYGVCMNNEVVMLQPQMVTPLYLGPVVNYS